MTIEPIDLDREFHAPPDRDDLDAGWDRALAEVMDQLWTWDTVPGRGIVILGEAGSGKSTEMLVLQRRCRSRGEKAFLIHLHELATYLPLETLGEQRREFEEWRTGNQSATLCLDSLDEAKAAGHNLAALLRRVTEMVGTAASRMRVVLTCRPSEWNDDDASDVNAALARWDPGAAHTVKLVSIAALDEPRVRQLARAYGVEDLDGFWTSIDEHGLVDMTARPQDVEWLSGYWRREHRFADLTTMIETSLEHRLVDRRESRHGVDLPARVARAGAERLAAFATLTGTRSFSVRADLASQAPPIESVLPSWRRSDIRGLLQLAIFDESTSGRVRIHTKELQEYLAARWLMQQHREALLTDSALLGLLLRPTNRDQSVVPSHLASVSAWIAARHRLLCDAVTANEPQHLIGEGDPEQLPVPIRERVLRSYFERFKDRARTGLHLREQTLRRFAALGLTPRLIGLLSSSPGEDVMALLLEIVAAGRLQACAGIAGDIATSPVTPSHVRIAAVEAAARAGDANERLRLMSILEEPDLDLDLAGILIAELFPEPLNIELLERLLRNVVPRKNVGKMTRLEVALSSDVPRRCPAAQRVRVLRLFETFGDDADWLRLAATKLVVAILSELPDPRATPELASIVTWLIDREYGSNSHLEQLRRLATKNETSRRGLLELIARADVDSRGRPLGVRILVNPLLNGILRDEDLAWFVLQAAQTGDEQLATAAIDAQRMYLNRAIPPPGRVEVDQTERAEPELTDRDLNAIAQRREEVREGNARLLQAIVTPFSTGNDWGTVDVEKLELELGPENMAAVREGLRRIRQRDFDAPRTAAGNSTPGDVVLALISLGLEFRSGLLASALSDAEARNAARLAMWELGALPEWIAVLIEGHGAAVIEELRTQLRAEVSGAAPRQHLLPKLFRAPVRVRDALVHDVEVSLRSSAKTPLTALELGIALILATDTLDRQAWKPVLQARLDATDADADEFVQWWMLQLYVDAVDALRRLNAFSASGAGADAVRARRLVGALWDALEDRDLPDRFLEEAQTLQTLYACLCAETFGLDSAFDPATRLRSDIVRRLKETRGSGAYFQSLASRSDGRFPMMRDWHLRLASESWLSDPTCAPMSSHEATKWIESLSVDPTTGHGLFALVQARLSDIASFLRQDMRSYRGLFLQAPNDAVRERHFQLWVAAELQTRSNGVYSVVREEENADENAPDIAIHHPRTTPISIELKVAESWSLRELEAALSTQLVGQYLSPGRSTRGILIVCATQRGRIWRRSGQQMQIEAVLDHLRAMAEQIEATRPDLEALEVIFLDFR